ncbi:HET-domain-containing protein [Apiospora hydei]|uniref:HET-domain-containing protein n=1 Tax=Apiospora hydei TaxID=1337664 RepID=A0ABR1VWA1_9PEZI
MRLLVQTATGEIHLEDFFSTTKLPRYAILSHTWGSQEVNLQEVPNGTNKHKHGHEKDPVLHPISPLGSSPSGRADGSLVVGRFKSYLLQPLLNSSPERGVRLGDKRTLESLIEDITGIPADALRGRPLSDFSVFQRLAWANGRNTTRSEDKAYSLLGLFDIQIPLLYGEGQANAMRRLREEIHNAESRISPLRRSQRRQAVTYVDYDICFLESCSRYLEYPNSLLFNASSRSKVRDFYRAIHDPGTKNKIFDAKANHFLTFLELKDGENDMCVETAKSLDDVKRHLHGARDIVKDPKFRYVSMEGWSPHLPLNCSFEMFAYLCSYHQIPESVLDHVFAFRSIGGLQGVARTGFHSDDTLSVPDKEKMAVPSANRSASAIRLSYLLSVVERSEPNQSSNWDLRQLAVYHSFDVIHGLSQDISTSFSSTLNMQLLLLEAGCDNWCWHLDELERSLQRITNKAQRVNLDTVRHLATLLEGSSPRAMHANSIKAAGYPRSFQTYESQPIPNRWNEKQSSTIGHQAVLPAYISLRSHAREIRRQSATEFAWSLRKLDKFGADLDRKKKQWETLEKLARDGKSLHSNKVSRVHAESAHDLALKMEKIASKTEEEAASMRLMAMVTLFFLPGSVLLSFLQGDIFQWNEPFGEDEATWIFGNDAFGLSAVITRVSMISTFLAWFFMFRCIKGRSRRQLYDIEEGPGMGIGLAS